MTFFSILHFIQILPIFQFLVNALPNRMMTSPYKIKIHNLSLFCPTFILYGFCLYFNFSSMPSLLEYDQPLYFFFRLLWFAAQWRSTSCHSRKTVAFPLQRQILQKRAAPLGLPSMTGTKQTLPYIYICKGETTSIDLVKTHNQEIKKIQTSNDGSI